MYVARWNDSTPVTVAITSKVRYKNTTTKLHLKSKGGYVEVELPGLFFCITHIRGDRGVDLFDQSLSTYHPTIRSENGGGHHFNGPFEALCINSCEGWLKF